MKACHYYFQMPEVITIYQISRQSPNWLFACAGLVPLIIGVVIIIGKLRFTWQRPSWPFAIFSCIVGLVWLYVTPNLKEDSGAFTAFETGQYSLVEGVVTNFHPMPYEGHDDECFSVRSK